MAASRVMGTGTPQRLAMRRGHALGAKVPRVGRALRWKHCHDARREYTVSTEPRRIGEKARSDPRLVFTSLYHHVCDVEHPRACFGALPADRAVGIDGITKEQYGANLDENLRKLSERLRNMGYRPQPKRRTYIPKPGSTKGRSLAISCFYPMSIILPGQRQLSWPVSCRCSLGCEPPVRDQPI